MFSVNRFLLSCLALFLCPHWALGADPDVTKETLEPGTVLHVQLHVDARMKAGAPVRGHILESIYVSNRLTVPQGSVVSGQVVEVVPASSRKRNAARLQGDFTPLHEARVVFDHLRTSDGAEFPIATAPTQQGVQTVQIESLGSGSRRPSLLRRLFDDLRGRETAAINSVKAPGKASRLKKFAYHQLPYHPETVDAGLEYNAELIQPVALPVVSPVAAPDKKKRGLEEPARLHALLLTDLNSREVERGAPVTAKITQPLFDKQNQLVVPEGTLLLGSVTQSVPAGKWGKNGALRFAFRQMQFPAGFQQSIHGTTTSVQSSSEANLQMDAEGGVRAKNNGLGGPLVMALISAATLHDDESTVFNAGASSNGFALMGRIIGIASGSRYVGAAIGLFATGRTVYTRFIARGSDVAFPHNTRVEIQVDPTTSPALRVQQNP
ncbi:MAG TPA: hypothetical protein VK473_13040 [Terriglobales bacterium]|nr:hypothetical protein [Terriglobales bacterium]